MACVCNVRTRGEHAGVRVRRTPTGYHPMDSDPLATPGAAGGLRVVPQPVSAPLTRAAIFLVVTVNPGADNRAILRSFCGDLSALLRAVEFRRVHDGRVCR